MGKGARNKSSANVAKSSNDGVIHYKNKSNKLDWQPVTKIFNR